MKNLFKKDINYIIAGSAAFLISVVFNQFNTDAFVVNFLAGLFAGLSIPLNICGIYKFGRSLRSNKE